MTPLWEEVWERLSLVFDWLRKQVAEVNPAAFSRSGRTQSDIYPFGAFLTFSREGLPGVEDLVISIDCKREGSTLRLECDISTGEGLVLLDGPSARVGDTPNPEAAAKLVRQWLATVEDLLRSNKDLVCQAVAPGSPCGDREG